MGTGDAQWRPPRMWVVMDTCGCENYLINGGIVTDPGTLIPGGPEVLGDEVDCPAMRGLGAPCGATHR